MGVYYYTKFSKILRAKDYGRKMFAKNLFGYLTTLPICGREYVFIACVVEQVILSC